jgi:hypothetical protein
MRRSLTTQSKLRDVICVQRTGWVLLAPHINPSRRLRTSVKLCRRRDAESANGAPPATWQIGTSRGNRPAASSSSASGASAVLGSAFVGGTGACVAEKSPASANLAAVFGEDRADGAPP